MSFVRCCRPVFAQTPATTGDRLRKVVEGVVEGTLRLSVDRWFTTAEGGAGERKGTAQADPEGFVKVFSRRDPRAQRSTMSFK